MLLYPVLFVQEAPKTIFIPDIPIKPFNPAVKRRHPQHAFVDFQRGRFLFRRYPWELYKRPEEQSKHRHFQCSARRICPA